MSDASDDKSLVGKILVPLLEKSPLFILVTGAIILLIGAAGQIPWLNVPIKEGAFQTVLSGVGLALIAYGAFMAFRAPTEDRHQKPGD